MTEISDMLWGNDGAALAAHLEHLRMAGHADTSVYSRSRAIVRLAAHLPNGVLDATADELMTWRRSLTVTADTVAHYVVHAREFYAWAISAGYHADNPAARLPVPKVPRRLPRPISENDLADAVTSADERIRLWLVLAAWVGLRAQEIAYLRRENVADTADPPVLLVTKTAAKGSRERVVPLSEFAVSELHRHGLPARGYVSRRRDGQPGPNQPWLVSRLANQHLRAQGIPATLHQLRHRFGTQTYRASRDLRLVQELLGHASPTTTAGYAAHDQAAGHAVVDALTTPNRPRPVRRTA